MGGKQADRSARKQAMKQQDDEPPADSAAGGGAMMQAAKELVMGSVLVTYAPQVPNLVLAGIDHHKAAKNGKSNGHAASNGDAKDNKENEEENEKEDKKETAPALTTPDDAVFDELVERLPFHNALGLGLPASGAQSKAAWVNLKGLEFDGGPKSRKKGSPMMDRLMGNFQNNAVQYWHVFLALMVLRSFLFRSFFACLPWLCLYQLASLMIPRGFLEEKLKVIHVHVGLRTAAAVGIHAFMWFFFLVEAVYRTYFLEKLLYLGIFAAHAYVMRPASLYPATK